MNSSAPPATEAAQEGHVYVLEPESSRILRLVIYSIIFVLAVLGNITVCILPFRNYRLRSFTYYLITNLAVSDIGAMLCLPYMLVADWNDSWNMGHVLCKLVNPSITMFSVITTNTLVAIAADRFMALVFPFRPRPGKTSSFLVIALTWLIAFLCVLPSFGSRALVGTKPNVYCVETFPADSQEMSDYYSKIYTILMYLINNLVPVVLIMVLYVIITIRLNKLKLTHLYSRNHNITAAKKKEARERKFTTMLVVVVVIFVLFYVPYHTLFLVVAVNADLVYAWKHLYIGYRYLYLMMWVPNALNPICYGSMDAHYARAFKALVRCTFKSQRYFRERISSVSSSYQWHSPKNGGSRRNARDFFMTETVNVSPQRSPPQSPVCTRYQEVRVTDV